MYEVIFLQFLGFYIKQKGWFTPIQQLRWSRCRVLAFGTQVCRFAFGRTRRIFRAKKSSFGGEVKPSVPCRSFAACKRSLNCIKVISAKLPDISRPQFHPSPLVALAWWHTWRRLVAKIGTSNQELTINLMAAVRSCINKNNSHSLTYHWFYTKLSGSSLLKYTIYFVL
jgi:hypothetical protein